MCQPRVIVFGSGKWQKCYRLEDMLLHLFFNALDEEQQQRFFREFECDEQGNRIVPTG